jgi:hypothetical protein
MVDARVVIESGPDGRPPRMVLHQMGREIPWVRVSE